MVESGSPLTLLLEKALALDESRRRARLAQAEQEFGYADLLREQARLVGERIALLKGFIDGPGRRYRIYHGDLGGSFDWKPLGPVYQVPDELLGEAFRESGDGRGRTTRAGATVWTGGFEAFDKGDLHFHSKKVPILFGPYFFEWIDRAPVEDGSDLLIESSSKTGDVLRDVRLRREEFELTAKALRIVRRGDVVEIHPVQ
jgi:hypothetical protein